MKRREAANHSIGGDLLPEDIHTNPIDLTLILTEVFRQSLNVA
jgi:hypothetical protein